MGCGEGRDFRGAQVEINEYLNKGGERNPQIEIILEDINNISNYEKAIELVKDDPKKSIELLKPLLDHFDKNPLIYYQRILEISKNKLTSNHLIGFEIDEEHGKDLVNLAKEYYPLDKVILKQDLTGKDRYLFIISE